MLFLVCVGLLVASLLLQQAAEDPQLQMTAGTTALLYRLHVVTGSIGSWGFILTLLYYVVFVLP